MANGTVNPTCNGFLSYTRYAPTRTLFPSEQFHFQSTSIPHFTMNGRVLYMGTTSHLTNFNESFNGLDARVKNRVEDVTGSANARRINVNADYGATWQLTPKIALNDIFDFLVFPSARDQRLYRDRLRRNLDASATRRRHDDHDA